MSKSFVDVEVTATRRIDIAYLANDLESELLEMELPYNGDGDYSTFDDLSKDDIAEVIVAIAEYWLQSYAGKQD